MRRLPIGAVVLLLSCAASFGRLVLSASAQTQWTTAQRIPGFDDSGYGPYFIADQNQTIHAFNSQFVDRSMAIVYSSWTLGDSWTPPVVIMDAYRGQARLTGVALDEAGFVHMTFFGGDDVGADIFYSQTHLSQAGRAGTWSSPVVIGPDAITPTTGALASDGKRRLVLLYSGNLANLIGNGLYEVHSMDLGETWSEPELVYLTETRTFWPTALDAIMGEDNQVHAVWSVAGVSGIGEAILYTTIRPDSTLSGEPMILAEAIDFAAATPSIVEHDAELKVIYHNGRPTSRWMIRSSDLGKTWTEPVPVSESHVGSNGPASMVIDSGGNLRMLFGGRTGPHPADHGMWGLVWLGDSWAEPEVVVSGPAFQDKSGGEGFDPSFARAIISQGNVLMVTWRTDPGAGPNGIWYSYAILDTPRLPVQPLPDLIPTQSTTEVPTIGDEIPEIIPSAPILTTLSSSSSTSLVEIVTVGALPAIAAVALVVIGVLFVRMQK